MGLAKDIEVRPISASDARRVVKAIHYSGKAVSNSQLHLGVFLHGKCGGAMQFGPPLVRRQSIRLVEGTAWHGFLELNRMAFADWLPRNSESRALGYAMRWIWRQYPWVEWVLSFADGTQCGDGTIYRAAGFVLTGIKKNTSIWAVPGGGGVVSRTSLEDGKSKKEQQRARTIARQTHTKGSRIMETGAASMRPYREAGFAPLPGYQLRYVYFLNPEARLRLTVPELPFSEIARVGAGMYRGVPRAGSIAADAPSVQEGEGGSSPTPALHQARLA